MNFKTHLESLQYTEHICHSYLRYGNLFVAWMEQQYIKPEELCYQHLRNFIEHRIKEKEKLIDMQLSALRHYCQFLINTEQVTTSFTTDFYILGIAVKTPDTLLPKERLQFIYENYPSKGLMGKRNKAILGLLIFQGLRVVELSSLKPEDINLKKKQVRVPDTRATNSRVLPLHKEQLNSLVEYISTVREMVMEVAELPTDKLFMCMGGSEKFDNVTDKLVKQIRRYTPEARATTQIRMSVMKCWLEEHGFERLQEMAGHRYVINPPRLKKKSHEL